MNTAIKPKPKKFKNIKKKIKKIEGETKKFHINLFYPKIEVRYIPDNLSFIRQLYYILKYDI